MIEGVIKYSGDQEFYFYEVEGNRVTWCARVGDGEIPPGHIGQKLHQEILDDVRHQQEKRATTSLGSGEKGCERV